VGRSISIEPNYGYMSFPEPRNTPHGIKTCVIHFRNIKNPCSIDIQYSLFIITSIITFWCNLLQFVLVQAQ